jgi:hypothetical protein
MTARRASSKTGLAGQLQEICRVFRQNLSLAGLSSWHGEMSLAPWSVFDARWAKILVKPQRLFIRQASSPQPGRHRRRRAPSGTSGCFGCGGAVRSRCASAQLPGRADISRAYNGDGSCLSGARARGLECG